MMWGIALIIVIDHDIWVQSLVTYAHSLTWGLLELSGLVVETEELKMMEF